jgi:hypothetical protein
MAQYEKIQAEDHDLGGRIKTLDNTVDYHTKDRPSALQEHRNGLVKSIEVIGQSAS